VDTIAPVMKEELIVGMGFSSTLFGSFKKGTVPPLWQRAQFPGLCGGRNSWLFPFQEIGKLNEKPFYLCLNAIPVKGGGIRIKFCWGRMVYINSKPPQIDRRAGGDKG